jgi:hypothetical protein
MTDKEHLLWLTTVMQHLSYEIDEISKIIRRTVQGDRVMRKIGPDDPGLVPMKPIEVRRMILDSLGDSMNVFIDHNTRDTIE